MSEAADFIRVAADADDCHKQPVVGDRDINAAACPLVIVMFRDLDRLLSIGSFLANLMKSTDAVLVCAGENDSFFIDKVNVVAADVMDGVYNLLSQRFAYGGNHIKAP